MRRLREDRLLLLLAAALLAFGGGLGCDPELDGVTFRAASVPSDPSDRRSPPDWFMAFGGKKAPGIGLAELPYALNAPFGVEARMGVFAPAALAASAGAEGCIGLRDTASSDAHRLCVSYETAAAEIHVSFGAESAACPDATRAELALDDDGMNVTARYRCGATGPFTTLSTAASLSSSGEAWHAFVSAEGLVKGGQVAFDDFAVTSAAVPIHDPGETAFFTFEAWRLGLEAFYEIEEDQDLPRAFSLATDAATQIQFAASKAAGSAAEKPLAKAAASHAKLLAGIAKYQKAFVKTAGLDADALEALAAGP